MTDAPDTDINIERLPFDFQQHDWVQKGPMIKCTAASSDCPYKHPHGTTIKGGLMLVGSKGTWALVAEGGTPRK